MSTFWQLLWCWWDQDSSGQAQANHKNILSCIFPDSMSGAAGLVCKSVVPGMEGPLHYSPSLSTNRMPLHSTSCKEKPPAAACASSGFSCCSGVMPTCVSPPAQPFALGKRLGGHPVLYLDTSEINQRQQHLCSSPVHLIHLLTAQWDIGIAQMVTEGHPRDLAMLQYGLSVGPACANGSSSCSALATSWKALVTKNNLWSIRWKKCF